jgi:hypothetical protein
MTMAEAISCCDNLINFMEQKSFTTEQERNAHVYAKREI